MSHNVDQGGLELLVKANVSFLPKSAIAEECTPLLPLPARSPEVTSGKPGEAVGGWGVRFPARFPLHTHYHLSSVT